MAFGISWLEIAMQSFERARWHRIIHRQQLRIIKGFASIFFVLLILAMFA